VVDEEGPVDALPLAADTTQAMPDTTMPAATTPTAAKARKRLEGIGIEALKSLCEFATG